MTTINAIIVAAMTEEMTPFTSLLPDFTTSNVRTPFGSAFLARKGRSSILFLTTGVGMVAASGLLAWALGKFEPRAIVSVGSAGGLDDSLAIGDIVVGTKYVHGAADATAFGYAPGQVPGQPEYFEATADLVEAAQAASQANRSTHAGLVVSSDSFITEANVANMRTTFPGVLSADMESQALAQIAHAFDIPFASVRSISDVVGASDAKKQAQTFNEELDGVATAAARTVLDLLSRTSALDIERSGHGPAQYFSKASLQCALFLMLAKAHKLEPSAATLPDGLAADIAEHVDRLEPGVRERVIKLIAAGYKFSENEPSATLTAKDYDTQRAEFVKSHGKDQSGFMWPPTSQTVIKRFNGYWNDALTSIGLKPRRGRNRGGLKFSSDDYLFAIRSYVIDAHHDRRQPSFNAYTAWLTESGNAGKLPSGAAIRQRFGSWKEALNAAAIDRES
ncbi:5'-methylthioadenosine/S-adenosylhomocysteine nucleosidase [Trueperella pecoris]|uniref:5'-methylthioadenosine/S-adenosylhomocysteine nucleosidase n=1 Tax=Trueperella pecoris TaxID=2733571 RepID=UPI00186B950E|nr:5'-methylthioadenosine/S-adenosylhomocysteine nucleosidase [Trueperella pecoris]QOQ39683.1 5'-methylthioadenosine/S-adenosylhomocysteine nucleosidase [Trueperella pecoris]QTG75530.1 5'-methylthioadenosine/S-adenosylhomocysteine nucleosidase [Trueperella pecoris]